MRDMRDLLDLAQDLASLLTAAAFVIGGALFLAGIS